MNEYSIDDAIDDLVIEWQSKQWKLSAEENEEYRQELIALYEAKDALGYTSIPEVPDEGSESHRDHQNDVFWGYVEGIDDDMKDKVIKLENE